MNSLVEPPARSFRESDRNPVSHAQRPGLTYDAGLMTGEVLLLSLDFVCLFLAAAVSTTVYTHWIAGTSADANDFGHAPWVAAVLAPFILYDRHFGAVVSHGGMTALLRSFAVRFSIFAAVVLTLGAITQTLDHFPFSWLAIWFVTGLLLTLLSRALVAKVVRSLQRRGAITEVIAVVGAGPVADRLVQELRQNRPDTVELLGVFDDRYARADSCITPIGNLAQLIELGKTRKIDWILLALPPTAERRLHVIVQRLMALAVPIGLCPQHIGSNLPYRGVDYAGDGVPVSLLADRPTRRLDALIRSAEDFLPRWTITFALLPVAALDGFLAKRRRRYAPLVHQFDNYDLERFTTVAASFGLDRYAFVVTPNADHIIRLHESAEFRALYASADHVLLDSRFLSHLLRVAKGLRLPVCTGSDLTENLLSRVAQPTDTLVLIGGTDTQAQQLRERYGLLRLAHFCPPMGFINDPAAVDTCLRFIESHSPFRFCFLAVGSPQQESIARHLKARGAARGLALCVGASINFLTGDERRAPRWMQRCGMEWFYRLTQSPGRMAKRYLVRGPRVFGLLRRAHIVLRNAPPPILQVISAPAPAPLPTAPRVEQSSRPRVSAAS